MGKYFSVILIGVLAILTSCADQIELEQTEYMVFGRYGAYCGGETCEEFFRLETERLFEETSDSYPGSGFHPFGQFVQLTQAEFDLAKDIESKFPTRLLVEPDTILGTPDVLDVGSVYFELKTASEHRYWIFNNGSDNMLPEYQVFSTDINTLINQLD